jgi:uncharacterized membrane protein
LAGWRSDLCNCWCWGSATPSSRGEIREELDRLRDNELVRVIDVLAVRKGADGKVVTLHESQLGPEEQQAFGAIVGGLIGLGAAEAEVLAASEGGAV